MQTIEKIEIEFENCEVHTLLPQMFKCLIVNGIKENLDINCYQYTNGEIHKSKTCEEFSITINEEGLNTITWNGTLKERINKFKDIASIIIYYESTKEEIYVPWCDKYEFANEYQSIEQSEEEITVNIKEEK